MGRDEDAKKIPVSTSELEKLKKLDLALDSLCDQIDPFNISPPQASNAKVWNKWLLGIFPESKSLFQEYVIDPQKHRKSKKYSGFLECKQKSDLKLSKEDPEDIQHLGSRLDLYSENLPIPSNVNKMVSFLKDLPQVNSTAQRKSLILLSQKFSEPNQRPANFTSTIKKLTSEILSKDLPAKDSLDPDDKLKLLKIMTKYPGDWEKVSKKFQSKSISPETLKQFWRCLKFSMNQESAEIQKKMPSFNFKDWLKSAKKKLEHEKVKKKVKIMNFKPKEERFDILSVMAEVENTNRIGIESETFLNISGKSAFKEYSRIDKLQECCLNRMTVLEC